jgi:hypothetical protein
MAVIMNENFQTRAVLTKTVLLFYKIFYFNKVVLKFDVINQK